MSTANELKEHGLRLFREVKLAEAAEQFQAAAEAYQAAGEEVPPHSRPPYRASSLRSSASASRA